MNTAIKTILLALSLTATACICEEPESFAPPPGADGEDMPAPEDEPEACAAGQEITEGAFLTWSACTADAGIIECCIEAGAPAGYVVDLDFRNADGDSLDWGEGDVGPALSFDDVWISDGRTRGGVVSWDLCAPNGGKVAVVVEAKDPDAPELDGWLGAYRVLDFDESYCP